ncbi:hypothetical protein GWO43_09070 [candidate division KSB1 bacterium]|nr:hypothetical protein [candidate division KSB1 bacterium]NIR68610.1 hypothetical protein [candidate division KSB1 bacterium]NIS24114.1 hypothetical protein [candidate division KSB1 bacterium]NIT71031.1 hypothetical protein [candidate division KSB1 bacterium]NIU24733.1 hypothetical protein [candidate division KSB1 bacterium]
MTCKQVSKHFPDYLVGELAENLRSDIKSHLNSCESCQSEFESLNAIWSKLAALPEEQPSTSLHERFQTMLEAYTAGQKHAKPRPGFQEWLDGWLERWWPRQPAFQFGLSVVLLLFGLFIGYQIKSDSVGTQDVAQLQTEVHSLRQLVTISLLRNQSPGERLRGVSYSYRVEEPDQETLSVLLNTLNYDPNLNVRLAAVDALSYFYEKPSVRRGLMQSLSRQTSPLIQIALINLLVEMEEKQAVDTLKLIQNNEMFNQTVRKRSAWAVEQLEGKKNQ